MLPADLRGTRTSKGGSHDAKGWVDAGGRARRGAARARAGEGGFPRARHHPGGAVVSGWWHRHPGAHAGEERQEVLRSQHQRRNRVGGTGVVGMDSVAKAKPDGYTVGVITFNLSTYRLLGQSELSYRDFDLIALLNRSPAGLSIKADSQFRGMKELVEYAKANPGVVTIGHSGPAGAWHLAGAAIAQKYGLKFTFVPFDGAAPTRTALVGGHISMCASGMDEVLQFYQTKQVRILAAVTPTRNPFFPDVPTLAEAGYLLESYIYDWRGLATTKGTPPEVLKVLRDGFQKAAEDPEYIALMDKVTLPRTYLGHEKFQEFLIGMEKSLEPTLEAP